MRAADFFGLLLNPRWRLRVVLVIGLLPESHLPSVNPGNPRETDKLVGRQIGRVRHGLVERDKMIAAPLELREQGIETLSVDFVVVNQEDLRDFAAEEFWEASSKKSKTMST